MTSSIRETKRRHQDELMARPGVLAVGVGLAPDGTEAIVVSVRRGDDAAAAGIPAELEGHPVVVQFTEPFRAL